MRKRLGALHAESLEEYIQLASEFQFKELTFYQGESNQKTQTFMQFDYADQETNNTSIEEEDDKCEYSNVNILIMDQLDQIEEVFKYCGITRQSKENYYLEYCSKCEISTTKEVHFHFWIINNSSVKYSEIIDLYFKKADSFIFLYQKGQEESFQMFIEKVKALKRDASSVIYKITNTSRVSSQQNLQSANDDQIVSLRNLDDGLTRVRNQYF